MQRALFYFQRHGVELSTFVVDMQQIFKVSRKSFPKGGDANAADGEKVKGKKDKDKENNAKIDNGKQTHIRVDNQEKKMKKAKKTDSLHLLCGLEVACFLAHKANWIEKGVFHQIHKIRRVHKELRSNVEFVLGSVQ